MQYKSCKEAVKHHFIPSNPERKLVGVDVTLFHRGTFEQFYSKISHINVSTLRLKLIANRGVQVWPQGQPETFCIDEWRCRFLANDGVNAPLRDVIGILQAFDHVQMDVIKAEFLYTFDGKPGF